MTSGEEKTAYALPGKLPVLLLAWYDKSRRILPWREDPTPYHVWISEIMLQQTRVEAVIPYYERFLKELPDVKALAEAPEERLLKLWEGLGYYSRVRNLQKAARQIMEDYDGSIPADPKQLEKLSGIGGYTAAAIASIAYQVPAASVDGNLLRVWARLAGYEEDIRAASVKKSTEQAFLAVLPKDRPGDMNQALMDLGATICLPNGAPLCARCPVSSLCEAYRSSRQNVIPKASEKKPRPVEHRTVLLVRCGDRILLHKRPKKGLLAGLYEFPNPEGSLSASDVKAILTAAGLTTETIRPLPPARHIFTHLVWEMTGYEVTVSEDSNPSFSEGSAPKESIPEQEAEPFPKEKALLRECFFVPAELVLREIPLPSAFSAYSGLL